MKLKLIALIAAVVALATPVHSAGLIGENYTAIGVGYREVESGPNGLLADIGANFAVHQGVEYGFDVHTSYGQVHLSRGNNKFRSHVLAVDWRGYTNVGYSKPFVEFNTGWQWNRDVIGATKTSYDSLTYGFTAGAEFALGDQISLTPSVNWTRWDDFKTNGFFFGVAGHMWITDGLGVELAYTLGEGSSLLHTVKATATFRF